MNVPSESWFSIKKEIIRDVVNSLIGSFCFVVCLHHLWRVLSCYLKHVTEMEHFERKAGVRDNSHYNSIQQHSMKRCSSVSSWRGGQVKLARDRRCSGLEFIQVVKYKKKVMSPLRIEPNSLIVKIFAILSKLKKWLRL